MRTITKTLFRLFGVAGVLAAPMKGLCNSVPYSESFEPFGVGHLISAESGWTAPSTVYVTNSPDASVYTNTAGYSFPVPGSHAKVLALGGPSTNAITSVSNGVVAIDLLVMPSRRKLVDSDPSMQLAAYVASNGQLAVWHQNRTNALAPFNEWLVLTNSPVLPSNVWSRLSVVMDQSNSLYQVSVNGAAPLEDGCGWTTNGTRPGSWFYMVQTNHIMAHVSTLGDVVSYLDDLVVAKRVLTLSTNRFAESAANDGTIDNTSAMTVGLTWDTFAATNGENLAATTNKLAVTNLPPGLAVSALVTSSTQLTVTITGQAGEPYASSSISNLVFAFGNAAFNLGRAWDVTGASATNLIMSFLPLSTSVTSGVTVAGAPFAESVTNDGTFASPVNLTLTNGLFINTSPFVSNVQYTASSVPDGLTLSIERSSPTTLVASLAGAASAHTSAQNGTIQLALLDAAFQGGLLGSSRSIGVTFRDPAFVDYGGPAFSESVTNDGSIGNTVTLTLTGATFTNAAFVRDTHFTATGVPSGLGIAVTRSSDTEVVISLTGKASPHTVSENGTIQFAFTDAAFSNVPVAFIGSASNAFSVTFMNPPVLSYSPTVFTERGDDIGAMGNSVGITLVNATFASGPFQSNVQYTVAGVPPGLALDLSRSSGNLLVASLTGQATAHAATNSTSITLSLLDPAFQAVPAAAVSGTSAVLTLTFIDTPPANTVPFSDSFENYPNGFSIIGTNGWLGGWSDSGVVTNDGTVVPPVQPLPVLGFPLNNTTHARILQINDGVTNRTRSLAGQTVYLDMMAFIAGRDQPRPVGANDQMGVYVNTNQQLLVWTRDPSVPTNLWRVLSGATVTTGAWHRLTVYQNYAAGMFKMAVDSVTISDAAGWSGPAGSHPGPWFYMVQTNGYLSEAVFTGGTRQSPAFVDDVNIVYNEPAFVGTLFKFR